MEERIHLKWIQDIEIKLVLCKSNFFWKILAEKYEETSEKLSEHYAGKIPDEVDAALTRVRLLLVEKKGELPPEDLVI